jgi:hypothetical protein
MTMPDDATEGRNAPYGAAITFSLKAAPQDEARAAIKLVISDAGGKVVRTMAVGKEASAGVNRVWWDLRTDDSQAIMLRTSPQHAADFRVGPDGTRKFPTGGPLSVLVPPGTYSVKLIAAGIERVEPIVIRKDPNTVGTDADVAAQTRVLLQIRDNVNVAAKAINDAELVRAQLSALRGVIGDGEAQKAVLKSAADLDAKIADLESRLFNMTSTGRGQDMLRTPSQMVEKLSHLADVVSYSDFAPTDSQLEVNAALTQQLAHDQEQIAGVLAKDVALFNAIARVILAEGDYRAIARNDDRTFERAFKVITGVDGEVEVLAR